MSEELPVSEKAYWRAVLQQQKVANARRWLTQLETAVDLNRLVIDEYDNLLRVLEMPKDDADAFELAYAIIQRIHPIIVSQADWERWLTYLENAALSAKTLKYEVEEARLMEQISDILFFNGNFVQAETFCRRSMALYKSLRLVPGFANSLLRIANIYIRQGRSSEAINLCTQAVDISKQIEAPAIEANAYLTLSNLFIHTQETERSLHYGRDAFSLYLNLGDEAMASQALLTVLACLGTMEQWPEAEEIAEKLAVRYVEQEDIYNLSQLKNNLGVIAFQKGEFIIAEGAWQEALRLHSQMQYPAEAAAVYNNLGMVYTRLGEWQEAERMLQGALKIYESIGDLFNWANTMDNLADLHEARGETAVCRKILQATLEQTQGRADTPHLAHLQQTIQQRLISLSL